MSLLAGLKFVKKAPSAAAATVAASEGERGGEGGDGEGKERKRGDKKHKDKKDKGGSRGRKDKKKVRTRLQQHQHQHSVYICMRVRKIFTGVSMSTSTQAYSTQVRPFAVVDGICGTPAQMMTHATVNAHRCVSETPHLKSLRHALFNPKPDLDIHESYLR